MPQGAPVPAILPDVATAIARVLPEPLCEDRLTALPPPPPPATAGTALIATAAPAQTGELGLIGLPVPPYTARVTIACPAIAAAALPTAEALPSPGTAARRLNDSPRCIVMIPDWVALDALPPSTLSSM